MALSGVNTDDTSIQSDEKKTIFSGTLYFFHAFDIGEDLNLERVSMLSTIKPLPLSLPKYFKNYHAPLAIEPVQPYEQSFCIGVKLHSYGAVSFTYKMPFSCTLEELRKTFNDTYNRFHEQSMLDAKALYKIIHPYVLRPYFFHTRAAYTIIQVDPQPETLDVNLFKERYGNIIASLVRFETETLAEYQKNEILNAATGYYRGELLVVDTDVLFAYDAEYADILDMVEFANIQQLELRFFDRLLDEKLNRIYEGEGRKIPLRVYLPFIGTPKSDPIVELEKLKVDISVITERLESSIKLAGEPYLSEMYALLVENLDLKSWQSGIERKLNIIRDLQSTYQHKIDVIREDLLTVLIIALIFIELIIGTLSYLK